MKQIICLISGLIMVLSLGSCEKSDSNTSSGTFTITTTDGKKKATSYVNTPIATSKEGTFSLKYIEPEGVYNLYQWHFRVLMDNDNVAYLDIILPTKTQNGVTYTSNYNLNIAVTFTVMLNDTNVEFDKSEVVFESSSYPGHIKGTVKGLKSDGTLVCTGDFDFVSK